MSHLNPADFTVHDISAFPCVLFVQEQAEPGYALRWESEMNALLEHGQPFVIVYDQLRREEEHADRKRRGLWLKRNKAGLGRACRAMISIEPDAERRAQAQAMGEVAVKAFGVAHQAVASREEALRLCARLVAE